MSCLPRPWRSFEAREDDAEVPVRGWDQPEAHGHEEVGRDPGLLHRVRRATAGAVDSPHPVSAFVERF